MASPSIMFIAGDPSGDQHAAFVIRQLRKHFSEANLWGIGGSSMESEGFSPSMPFAPFNKMGFAEVALHIGFFLDAKKKLIGLLAARKPDLLVCVDYPGLNIPLMKAAHALGIPVVWYIAPMVWAWKRNRAEILGANAAHIGVIFPFEVDYYKNFKAPVSFVGNPTVEVMTSEGIFYRGHRSHPGKAHFHVALVPGSRRQEIEKMLPRMVEAFGILKQRFPGLTATVSRYSGLPESLYKKIIGNVPLNIFEGPLRELLAKSNCALVTSGTATLETALLGVPHIIVYKTSYITYTIAKRLVKIAHIGLPNIIAGESIVPECIQHHSEGANLALTLEKFITSPKFYNNTVKKLVALREKLGEKKPSVEVSGIIKELIDKNMAG